MTYQVYLDLYFLENAVMDSLILAIVGRMMRYPVRWGRIIPGGCTGALWAVSCMLLTQIPPVVRLGITALGISAFMLIIAYPIRSLREMAKAMASLYFVAFLLAGALYGMVQAGILNSSFSLTAWLFSAVGVYFGILGIWEYVRETERQKRNLYLVTLYYKGRKQTVTALMDTGNHLREPVTGKPVHILTWQACRLLCQSVDAVMYVPYHSIGKEQGLLPAIWMDKMEIQANRRTITVEKPLIAIYREALSQTGEYEMLVQEL